MLIREAIDLVEVKGKVGIEIEIEGVKLPDDNCTRSNSDYWKADLDGSLKAAEAFEYVLRHPISILSVKPALEELWGIFDRLNSEIFESPKAGVHVHLNVQDFTINELVNLITLFFIFEKPLVKYCGSDREGNLFCLRASDASDMIPHIISVIKTKKLGSFKNDDYRYSSINLKSVAEYGSVEFRTMRSTADMDAILSWVKILWDLYRAAKVFDNPRQIICAISGDGYDTFAKSIFKTTYHLIPVEDTFEQDIYEGICHAQDIAYCVNWDKYTLKSNNPFLGRG